MNNLNSFTGWFFGSLYLLLGILYIWLIHPVPGIVCILFSLIYFPPVNNIFYFRSGKRIPVLLKIAVGIFIIWFTLGVSDMGDLIDNYFKS
jgi:hypothetical protein